MLCRHSIYITVLNYNYSDLFRFANFQNFIPPIVTVNNYLHILENGEKNHRFESTSAISLFILYHFSVVFFFFALYNESKYRS